MTDISKNNRIWTLILIISAVFAAVSLAFLLYFLCDELMQQDPTLPTEPSDYAIMDSYDALIGSSLKAAQSAAENVPRAFPIDSDALAAPEPDAAKFGTTTDASELGWLLEEAAQLLNGQETVFTTEIEIFPGSEINYYLDDSIFVVAWQQLVDNYIYTFSEVKISHASQFRRYLAKNEFNSDYLHSVLYMAEEVNAVLASSADFYRGRNQGIVVYQGEVKQSSYSDRIDTCFVDTDGDLILVPAGQFESEAAIVDFVTDNDISFSIAFGPILVDDGVQCEPDHYYIGEVNGKFPRAALCQKDTLHYVLVMANRGSGYHNAPTIHMFAEQIAKLGCIRAYAMDGGLTTALTMNGKNLNPWRENNRWVSDILYFGTGIPSGE